MDLTPHDSDDEETLIMKENLIKINLKRKLLAKGTPQDKRQKTPPPKIPNPFASPRSARHNIQVPASPSPQKIKPLTSPARITLGIDKGRTGRDVSLRRTPEKPKKTFNQRIAETRAIQGEKTEPKSRLTAFNPVPVFNSSTDITLDSHTNLRLTDCKVSPEDCTKVVSTARLLSLHDFYSQVAPPDYEMLLDNYIVYGIVASKSTARTATNGAKYCVLTLTDLKTDISMFFYDSAFDKFWTLPLGTLCYFLNPLHQKPTKVIKQVSLKMTSHKGILEIGKAADFGLCRSIKKDGQQCTRWINSRKQEVCDEHIDMALQKTLNKRIEFASGTRQFDPRQQSKKKKLEGERYAQHAVFFGEKTLDYEAPLKDTARLQKESESRQKEREVLARLLRNSTASAGHEYFDIENAPPEKSDLPNRVFSAEMVRKLGFDPTGGTITKSKDIDTMQEEDDSDLEITY